MNDAEDMRSVDLADELDLAAKMERAQRALARAGLTVQDLLDALPAARAAVLQEAYDERYRREIDQLIAAFTSAHGPLPLGRD